MAERHPLRPVLLLDASGSMSQYSAIFLRFMLALLKRVPEGAGKLVVLEGVYSMLGDIAPLKEMVAVSKANGAMVLVDEAHSMGFMGEHGRGVAEAQGVIDDVDFIIGTFSK